MFDLIGGRATWTAIGLPTEGAVGDRGRIASVVKQVDSVPFHSTMADVRRRATRYPVAVLGSNGVLVGSIDDDAASLPGETPVPQVMKPAPRTIRGELRIDKAAERLRKDRLDHVFVTTVNGALLGLVSPDDLKA